MFLRYFFNNNTNAQLPESNILSEQENQYLEKEIIQPLEAHQTEKETLQQTHPDLIYGDDFDRLQHAKTIWQLKVNHTEDKEALQATLKNIKEQYDLYAVNKKSNVAGTSNKKQADPVRFSDQQRPAATLNHSPYGKYPIITDANAIAIRGQGDAFKNKTHGLANTLKTGTVEPHEVAANTTNNTIETLINEHKKDREHGQENLISYANPNPIGQKTIDFYTKRQSAQSFLGAYDLATTPPIIVASPAKNMAAENPEFRSGMEQNIAIGTQPVIGVRPCKQKNGRVWSVERSDVLFVRKGLPKKTEENTINALLYPNEQAQPLTANKANNN